MPKDRNQYRRDGEQPDAAERRAKFSDRNYRRTLYLFIVGKFIPLVPKLDKRLLEHIVNIDVADNPSCRSTEAATYAHKNRCQIVLFQDSFCRIMDLIWSKFSECRRNPKHSPKKWLSTIIRPCVHFVTLKTVFLRNFSDAPRTGISNRQFRHLPSRSLSGVYNRNEKISVNFLQKSLVIQKKAVTLHRN